MKKVIAMILAIVALMSSASMLSYADTNDCMENFNKCLESSIFVTSKGLKDQYVNCSAELASCLANCTPESYVQSHKVRAYIGDWGLFLIRLVTCISDPNYEKCLYEDFEN